MEIAIFIACVLIMLTGLAGTVLPVLPGLPVVWLVTVGFGWYSGWVYYGWKLVALTGVLAVGSIIVDQVATLVGSKTFGASRAGMIGSVAGAIIGLLAFSLPGLVIGTFAGAMLCEMIFSRRNFGESFSAGLGALLGFLAGGLFKFMLGCFMIALFVFYYFRG